MNLLKTITSVFILSLLVLSKPVFAMEFDFKKVADKTYAYIGPLTNRTPENLGLNNNIGLVLTKQGAVLIDSGAGIPSAKALEKAVKKVTDLPIIAVINTGSQDHRWLGNGYFSDKGAKIYALEQTVKTQLSMGAGQVEKMTKVTDIFASTKPVTSLKPFPGDKAKFTIGDVKFELIHFGDAHFPGDAVVWLPEQKTLFSGDLIYVDRMLGVLPFSNVASWQKAFHAAEALPAKVIVPGHGQVCDWDKARKDTGNYLDKLVSVMSAAADEMLGVGQAVEDNKDWPEFKHLEHYDTWHKTILNRTYLQFENGM
ncbi:MBL fold metallo-hydrolase [Thiomicrorhabdus sp.]|uniref:MBL fold metallo-hydrolase n=1 Tax=Thiomicrorhabdus sp. TaxID=2039724 RepID=UPI002AA8C825|nr:MBL fold metallo-hydrolase [Thiomicrorhabdus sp.]